MNIKSYQVGEVQFHYSITAKKWEFVTPGAEKPHTVLVPCRGQGIAQKVAKTINGTIQRKGLIDNLCRFNIGQIVAPRIKLNSPIRF